MSSAIAGCNHRDIVASSDASVLAFITEERRHIRGNRWERDIRNRELKVECQLFECDVVRVYVGAWKNVRRSSPHYLTVSNDALTTRYLPQSQLVSCRN